MAGAQNSRGKTERGQQWQAALAGTKRRRGLNRKHYKKQREDKCLGELAPWLFVNNQSQSSKTVLG